jgi:molecular chaperone DnaJ
MGTGNIRIKKNIDIKVEGGVTEPICYHGHGNQFGQKGDLYIVLQVARSNYFSVKGNRLYTETLVDPLVAIIGGKVSVITPYGKKELLLKPRTINGEEIIITNAGINMTKRGIFGSNTNKGDLVVKIVYAKPSNYNSKELDKIKSLIKENSDVEHYNIKVEKEVESE